jgi:hypothetical protein
VNAWKLKRAEKEEAAGERPAGGLCGRGRCGEIARLPHGVREALNQRLRDGHGAGEILSWLNELPEAREMLKKFFGGASITKENLCHRRYGGYAGWVENQQTREAMSTMSRACRNIGPREREELTAQLALVVTARMVEEWRFFEANFADGDGKENKGWPP